MIIPFEKKKPKIHSSVFVAPGAHVIGDVTIGQWSSVWFTAVLRADLAPIHIGEASNIQDGAVVHVDWGKGCKIGDGVIIGHQATIHACDIGHGTLVGIGARILSGAKIGAFSLIGAGAVVLEDAVIPERSLVLGVPGKIIRVLTPQEAGKHLPHAQRYAQLAKKYKRFLG